MLDNSAFFHVLMTVGTSAHAGGTSKAIEMGKTALKMPTYFAMCEVLTISPRELMRGDIAILD